MSDPLVALGHVYLAYNEDEDPRSGIHIVSGAECILSPCARDYDISINEGILRTEFTATSYGELDDKALENNNKGFYQLATCWKADPGHVTYEVVETRLRGEYLYANVQPNTTNFAFCPVDYEQTIYNHLCGVGQTMYNKEESSSAWASIPDYSGLISSNVEILYSSEGVQSTAAYGMSKTMEIVATSLTKLALDLSKETVIGNVTTSEVYVLVRWEWLILRLALEVAGIILFASTIILSWRRDLCVWIACQEIPNSSDPRIAYES